MSTLAIDFDGTLAEGTPLRLRAGAAQAVAALKNAEHHLVLHSARCTPDGGSPYIEDEARRFWELGEVPARTKTQWDLYDEMILFLQANNLLAFFDEVWTGPGKPLADHFIDDLYEEPDWATIIRQYGQGARR
jgi:hypothetical protein